MSELDFLDDEKTQDAVVRNFEIIGEAAHNIELNHQAFPLPIQKCPGRSCTPCVRTPSLSEIETAWEQEIEHRVAAFDRGELPTYSAEEVFADTRRMAR